MLKSIFIFQLLILSFVFSDCTSSKKSSDKEEKEQIRNSIEITDLNGVEIPLKKFEGKVIFLSFWATWCAPCIKEMPSIDSVSSKFEDEVVFILASNEEVENIRQFKEKRPFKLNYVHIKTSPESLGVYALPATFIFDKNGDLAFEEFDSRNWNSEESFALIKNILNNE
jgi:thiol-disulfide isomerase/thioredoxin